MDEKFFDDPNILIDYHLYFDICQLIFPELNIPLIKLREQEGLEDAQKMQQLIDMLSEVLEVDLDNVSGEEVVGSNLEDIQAIVELLYQYSKIFKDANKRKPIVQSEAEKKDHNQLEEL